jgi:uridine kinase
MTHPILVGIAGGSGSGKTTVAEKLMQATAQPVVFVKQDSYYRNFDGLTLEEKRLVNYDHPDAYDNDLLVQQLQRLLQGQPVDAPVYNYARYEREAWTERVEPLPVISCSRMRPCATLWISSCTSTPTPMSGSSAAFSVTPVNAAAPWSRW